MKSGQLSIGMHPLSPPNSPSAAPSGSRVHETSHLQEQVFVGDCLTDNFDAIDRAEMNKYLLPDQNGMMAYSHNPHAASLGPSASAPTHMCSVPNMAVTIGASSSTAQTLSNMTSSNINSGPSISSTSSGTLSGTCGGVTLPSLQSVTHTRLMTPTSGFSGGSSSPYYASMGSPTTHEVTETRSPEVGTTEIIGHSGSPGDSGGSPEPATDYVELQPPRVPKEEPLSTLGSLKSPVNHFLPQNLCYSQHYPYNYSYAYSMWHG